MAALNVIAAFVLRSTVTSGQRIVAESHGKIAVSSSFLASAKALKSAYDDLDHTPDHPILTLTIRRKPGASREIMGVK